MRKTGVIRRPRVGKRVIGGGHHCKICSRPLRSGAPNICAGCSGKGHVDDVVKELEDRMKKQVEDEVNSWKRKKS